MNHYTIRPPSVTGILFLYVDYRYNTEVHLITEKYVDYYSGFHTPPNDTRLYILSVHNNRCRPCVGCFSSTSALNDSQIYVSTIESMARCLNTYKDF